MSRGVIYLLSNCLRTLGNQTRTLFLSHLASRTDDEVLLLLWVRNVRLLAAVVRVSCAHRDQVLVQGDGLVQPLPGLV